MEIIGSIVAFAFATACAIIAIWHEGRWRRRMKTWEASRGRVVGFAMSKPIKTLFGGIAASDDGPYPEIEFSWNGSPHRFVSGYGGSGLPRTGAEIDLLFDPLTGEAEHLSYTNRWLGTVIPLIFSGVFFWVSAYSIASTAEQAEAQPPALPADLFH
jgi:hypothetical protein